MKKHDSSSMIPAILAVLLAASTSSHATIVWTDGATGNSVFNNANWDFSGSSATSISTENTAIQDHIVITNPTKNLNVNGRLWLDKGYTLTATNANFTDASGGANTGIFRSQGSSEGEVSASQQAVFYLKGTSG